MSATDELLRAQVERQPYPLLFVTISGAHLYGFPSPDSDYDLRGCHVLPVHEVVGLRTGEDTIEASRERGGVQYDLVTHDAHKFFTLLLKRNGYVLEQLYSPLVVLTTPEHEELKAIAKGCITRHHSHHYLGFADTQWRLLVKHEPHQIKPLLYTYRILMAGIHLMRTGDIESNLVKLNEEFRLPFIPELIARKASEHEDTLLASADLRMHEEQVQRLHALLIDASADSSLSEAPTAKGALHDLLVRLRLAGR